MPTTRRLAAIMFTDMVGYTAAAQTDERAALALRKEQEELVHPVLTAHQGRKVKSTGDGFLVEFESALHATECAVDIQRRLRERNGRTGVRPIDLRIGIHLGDVEEDGTDIFGDAVNIASRIEPTAEPGGICISGAVREQVRNKIRDPLEKLPSTALKGVRDEIDIYRVVLPWAARDAAAPSADAPSLAVLPFANISPDPKDEYFADGLTEELISVLSQLPGLRVIARTSVMPYKAAPKPISQIGAELRVTTVLEGSVRKAGNRLRITAQLIDTRTQSHVWASTFDRDLDDVFAVQSEMAKHVADALKIKLLARDEGRLQSRPLANAESYLEYLQGRTSMHGSTEAAVREAKGHFERAIQLDDRNAAAHAGLADLYSTLGGFYRFLPKEELRAASRKHAARAIELDPNLAEAHAAWGGILQNDYDYAAAERELRLALELNPSYAWARGVYASLLADQCRTEEALREYVLAEQLDPLSTLVLGSHQELLTALRRMDEARALLERLGRADNFGLIYHAARGNLFFMEGDQAAFLEEVAWLDRNVPDRQEPAAALALAAARAGDGARTRELLRPIEALPEAIRPDAQIALAYAMLGDLDACFPWLERAIAARRVGIMWFRLDPLLAPLRADPRFTAILKNLNLA
jgi:adenylate cyclase